MTTWILTALALAGWLTTALLAATMLRRGRDEPTPEFRAGEPAVVAHEMRTPLTLINGAAELLAEESPGPLTDHQRTFVDTIRENSAQAIDIAENFITNLKLSNSSVQLNLSPVDIRATVGAAARQLAQFSDVPLYVDASGGLLPISADRGLVRQLVWNLIANAARHAGEGATITVRIDEGSGGGALIEVTDNGAGIPDSEREKLFTPFATGTSRRPGSGIGMTVVQQIARIHGGKVMVDSARGRGTAVVVYLPAAPPQLPAPQETRTARRSPKTKFPHAFAPARLALPVSGRKES
ncbi:sensor histidine kinase [Actinotignum sanguinis]|uniref:histidine kinase n=2 Tax=Actinomycetaceae TaxID=2049 RepID=A0ABZ0RBM6_9ACTO|nr:HAMP domain-containing sensor histidine kinase [Actinotignum sanguinis]MDK6787502.1 HAMP domain-containing sensor histidine kinase [Actinotignum timonense]WPJ88855.1 HAMP domain-containing sensor histidine kinase [Schaalia turicensis]MDE1656478.1 HAMP domain-containing sensor histidine kinase [Actinotignum sanguinis]MDK7197199.1 HAMP domain-containing sensor histidine kinase [Actinotignum sanguinis]MDK8353158.1 HAMP domain-containing sensor histidine kinase [Actinotignum sanguinis]